MYANYREDNDLEFLKNVEISKLEFLEKILLYDKLGHERLGAAAESFSLLHKKEGKRDEKTWEILASEIQRFGANSVVNVVRGIGNKLSRQGVLYAEIVKDIASGLELEDYINGKDIREQENDIIEKLIEIVNEQIDSDIKIKKQNSENPKVKIDDRTSKRLSFLEDVNYHKVTNKYELAVYVREFLDSKFEVDALFYKYKCKRRKGLNKFIYQLGRVGKRALDVYSYNTLFGPNWSVSVQSIIQLSILREPKDGLSIGLMGMPGAGKTTFLDILRTGNFSENYKQTVTREVFSSFDSPILGKKILEGDDVSGTLKKEQVEWAASRDVVFFFFNPTKVLSDSEYKVNFLSRFSYIKNLEMDSKKMRFIGTFKDMYEQNTETEFWGFIQEQKKQGAPISSYLNVDSCFFVSLKEDNHDWILKAVKEV